METNTDFHENFPEIQTLTHIEKEHHRRHIMQTELESTLTGTDPLVSAEKHLMESTIADYDAKTEQIKDLNRQISLLILKQADCEDINRRDELDFLMEWDTERRSCLANHTKELQSVHTAHAKELQSIHIAHAKELRIRETEKQRVHSDEFEDLQAMYFRAEKQLLYLLYNNNLNQQQIQKEITRLKSELEDKDREISKLTTALNDVNEDEEWRYMPQRSESEIQRDLEEEERYRNYDPEDDGDEHDDDDDWD